MSIELLQSIIEAAIQLNNYKLAAKVCAKLAQQEDDGSLWEMAGQLYSQEDKESKAITCYGHSVRSFARQDNIPQATLALQIFAAFHQCNEQHACRYIFKSCREYKSNQICNHHDYSSDATCQTLQSEVFRTIIPNEILDVFLQSAIVHHYEKDSPIIREGDKALCMYLVTKGEVQTSFMAHGKKRLAACLIPNDCLGEIPYFLDQSTYLHSAVALESTTVVEISYGLLNKLCKNNQAMKKWIKRSFKQHILEYKFIQTPFFSQLKYHTTQTILAQMTAKSFKAGEVIFRQGDNNNLDLFILKSGNVNINYGWYGQEYHICSLTAGDVFGELGIINSTRKVTVNAISKTHVLCLPENSFRAAYENHLSLREHVLANYSHYNKVINTFKRPI